MAEGLAATGSAVAAAKQDALLATKLYLPGTRPGFVPRPRLIDRLEEGLPRGLILVCAAAGSGKTALLADWARCGKRPVAWLSVDAGDDDPVRFWRHAVAALDRARHGIAERIAPLLGPPERIISWASTRPSVRCWAAARISSVPPKLPPGTPHSISRFVLTGPRPGRAYRRSARRRSPRAG
jgi:hypothetical protein